MNRTSIDWESLNPNMLLNVSDAKYYYETFTDANAVVAETNRQAIETLDGRVTKVEQEIPSGGGGTGAYLNLGGTPDRYPTSEEMNDGGKETSFMVIARTDGIYFYNPATKLLIKPKSGGGSMAVHGQLPMVYDNGHKLRYNGRTGMSGIFTADLVDVGLDSSWASHGLCKIIVVATEDGEELQTALHPDGVASRTFTAGDNIADWKILEGGSTGGGGSGASKFKDLLDTPSGYHPGKLLGYNLAADALIPVENSDEFTLLKDTPSTYAGKATNVLTVKVDESGLEFTPFPTGGGSGGSSSFVGLTDTPVSYAGQKGMLLGVKADESGLEYVEDSAIPIMGALEEGNLPIKWNNMKQKIAASSNNITEADIANNAFTLGLGGTAGRQYLLPNIVDADTSPLPANSVREGRLTIISQQGGGNRTVKLTSGCKFSSGGTASTTDLVIPPGQSWMLLPAIYSNGDKVWSLIGNFSSNDLTTDSFNGYNRVGSRCLTSSIHQNGSQIAQNTIATASMVSTTGSTNRTASLPEILPYNHSGWITNNQVRHGKILTFWGAATAKMVLAPHTGQKISVGGVLSDTRTLNPGIMETYIGVALGGVFQWILTNQCNLDGSPVGFDELGDRVSVLESTPPSSGPSSFKDLTDTPSGYLPGKMLSYNLAGDAIIGVDAIDEFKGLKDTPENYVSQAYKAVTVKADESGLEFSSMPNLAPLQSEVNDLHNDLIAVGNDQIIQDQRLAALELAGGGSDTFVGLTDTPDVLEAKKILTVNAAGTGVELSTATTDDLAGALVLAHGVTNGDVLLHQNCLGSPTVLSGEETIASSLVASSAMILISAWRDNTTVNLARITAHDTAPLPAGFVRAGRVTSLYNRTGNSKTVTVKPDPAFGSAVKMKNKAFTDITTLSLPPGQVVKFVPLIDAGTEYWVVIEQYTF